MAKYVRRDQVVEAEVFKPESMLWPNGVFFRDMPAGDTGEYHFSYWVDTPKGRVPVHPGEVVTRDWHNCRAVIGQEEFEGNYQRLRG